MILKFFLLIVLPFFSFFFLRKNFHNLDNPEFRIKYQTLYLDLKTTQRSAYLHTTFFSVRRFLIIYLTVYRNKQLISSIYVTVFGSLFMIKYLYDYDPFKERLLNRFEKMNELFTFALCYSIILFSDLVPNPEIKYYFGFIVMYLIGAAVFINVFLVF